MSDEISTIKEQELVAVQDLTDVDLFADELDERFNAGSISSWSSSSSVSSATSCASSSCTVSSACSNEF